MKLKLRAIGSSTGIILSGEALHRMKVKRGDVLFGVETSEGYLLTPHQELAEQLKLGIEISQEHRDTLRALAK